MDTGHKLLTVLEEHRSLNKQMHSKWEKAKQIAKDCTFNDKREPSIFSACLHPDKIKEMRKVGVSNPKCYLWGCPLLKEVKGLGSS